MDQAILENVRIIRELFAMHGTDDYIGEAVSQLEHACQSAQLAMSEGYKDDVVLAAYLHDIGHLLSDTENVSHMGAYGIADHEELASEFLYGLGFSDKVCRLVQGHVNTKRYLTYKYPEYYQHLSEASKATLSYQGGPMNIPEARAYESDPLFPLHLKIREWDDKAKETGKPLPDLEIFYAKIAAHLFAENQK